MPSHRKFVAALGKFFLGTKAILVEIKYVRFLFVLMAIYEQAIGI